MRRTSTRARGGRSRLRRALFTVSGTALVLASLLSLASLASGCQLVVDFNRALIEGGIDGAFFDAGEGEGGDAAEAVDGDATVDALVVPDAVGDVVFVDGTPADAGTDAHADATVDGGVKDSGTKG